VIASITGVVADRVGETVVIHTDGGVGYSITVPHGVAERLPTRGARLSLYTELVVREDGWALYGFDRLEERAIFQRLLGASGFGPKLALALLSDLGPERTVRSIRRRDIAALSSVSGIGKKKAERLVLELVDRFLDLEAMVAMDRPLPAETPGGDAVRALERLGYSTSQSERTVRDLLAKGAPDEPAELIRRALQALATRRGES
jgi:Holliday junction DNA helicase RuvA